MSEQNKPGEIPKEFFELQSLKNQREKLEASYREIFPKVDTYLLHDLLLRLKTHKIQGLPGTDQRLPDFTTNSFISIDGKYIFNLPPGQGTRTRGSFP